MLRRTLRVLQQQPHNNGVSSSTTPLSREPLLRALLQGLNDAASDKVEPFLHHDFTYEQAPCQVTPTGAMLYKFDFLKNLRNANSHFSAKKVEIIRMMEVGQVAVVESRTVGTLAFDIPAMGWKKGQSLKTEGASVIEFDAASNLVSKMKAYDCIAPPS